MTLEVESDLPSSELTVEACFNDECDSAPAPGASTGFDLELFGGRVWLAAAFSTAGDERLLLLSWSSNETVPTNDGDRYAVRVTTPDGLTVGESVEIAESYSLGYPNGEECGPACPHVDSVRAAP
jgi:hypothetical protein